MAQHIQLQQVVLHRVVLKVRGDDIGVGIIRRVLDRAEIVNLHIAGNDDQTAGVLTGGTLDAHTALGQPVVLRRRRRGCPAPPDTFSHSQRRSFPPRCRWFRHGTHGSRRTVQYGIAVGLGLIFAGEVQIDIRHLVAAKAQESLKRNIEAVLNRTSCRKWDSQASGISAPQP